MMFARNAVLMACLGVACAAPAAAQMVPPAARQANLSGPRFGVTALDSGIVDRIKTDHGIDAGRTISKFGWQVEKQFYGGGDGPAMITEAVALVGGLEQGVAIPSLSWMVGLRTHDGTEFGLGPN